MKEIKKVAIIGGGAAGFFAALSVAEHHPSAQITLYEKSSKVLSKVKVSGGGTLQCHPRLHRYRHSNTGLSPGRKTTQVDLSQLPTQRHHRMV